MVAMKSLAQQPQQTAAEIIQDIFEQYSAESETDMDYESFFNDLSGLITMPINLNSASRGELEKMPFLSDIQIENILHYRYQFGQLHSLYELQLIDGLDMTDIRRMLPFVSLSHVAGTIEPLYRNEMLRYGKNELLLRTDQTVETKKGYLKTFDEQGNRVSDYAGSPLYSFLKYNYHFKDRIRAGLSMEKDAGEQFWGSTHRGYDAYSFHFQATNLGAIKTIVVGDYRASFGQGLVINTGYGGSKSSYVLQVVARNNGLKDFSSTDEYNYLRGLGTTINLGKLTLSTFYSNKMLDGDTTNLTLTSIYKTGLHRTTNEYAKRNTLNQQLLGANATWLLNAAQIGFTVLHTTLSKDYMPAVEPYSLFYFKGNTQTTAGANYRMRLHIFNLFGETAITNNKGLATLNGCTFAPTSAVSLVALWRYYSPQYDTFFANAFSENTRINNETGLYLGAEVQAFRRWKLSTYMDSYRFPWLKYGVNAPSSGRDYLLQADYAPNRNTQMNCRIKYEVKEKNMAENQLSTTYPYSRASVRYQVSYSRNGFDFKTVVSMSNADSVFQGSKFGYAAYQNLSYSFAKIPLSIDLRYLFFDAPNYDNRFYFYENDVLYAFAIPVVSGIGTRYYLNLKYELNKAICLWFKIAQTVYSDGREGIGSGSELLQGNRKTDVRLLVRYAF
ncbi:MAG: hypothetical protein AUK44_01890 [Porphyromonadaceae bacterium CG2_30_38_12]|nr:MAG: hypothetical protein AUK44_01890 [Porphyromonadaceae bacterium CG2_30_38_12]